MKIGSNRKRYSTMKKLLAFIFTIVLAVATLASSINPPTGWMGQMWGSTLALYGTKGSTTHFLCTAEPIEKIDGGYRLLTAGHCVQETPAGLQFSVAEEIGGVRTPITLVKARLEAPIDFAIFDLKTTKTYTVFPLGDESELQVGDNTINPNFALGIGKQLSPGVVSALPLVPSEGCTPTEGCVGDFMVQEYAGPGTSGSAVLSVKTHKVVGLLVWEFGQGNVGLGVEPISQFAAFMAGPNQPHPTADTETADVSVHIPAAVFAAQFGPKHTFKLKVHGPSPVFVQNGYKFRANTDRFELSDKYYYKAKVFIDSDENGYRLTSTKEGVGVDVTVLGKE
jgi:hypothetical protein